MRPRRHILDADGNRLAASILAKRRPVAAVVRSNGQRPRPSHIGEWQGFEESIGFGIAACMFGPRLGVDDVGLIKAESRAGTESVDHKSRVLFSNPASTERDTLTVRLSYDDGVTWPVSKRICAGSAAYSSLAVCASGKIGCLYEKDRYGRIVLARFGLEWLTDGKDRVAH